MNIFEKIEEIEAQIVELEGQIDMLRSNMEEIVSNNVQYSSMCIDNGASKEDFGFLTDSAIRNDLASRVKQVIQLKNELEDLYDKVQVASSFSVADIIWLLEQYDLYYKTERYGAKTLLLPRDYVLEKFKYVSEDDINYAIEQNKARKNGMPELMNNILPMYITRDYRNYYYETKEEVKKEQVINIRDLRGTEKVKGMFKIAQAWIVDFYLKLRGKTREVPTEVVTKYNLFGDRSFKKNNLKEELASFMGNIPDAKYYVADETRVELNDKLMEMAPVMLVHDISGIVAYNKTKDGIKWGNLTNILPDEAIAFIDYFVIRKCQDSLLSFKDGFREYNEGFTRKLK